MTIELNNISVNGKKGVYIGRGKHSPLGNPYKITDTCTRKEAVFKYKLWLWDKIQDEDSPQFLEIQRLAKLYKENNELVLDCFCTPKACHGDVVKSAIEWFLNRETSYPSTIISGGQTGADFAGLVAARALGLKTGGTAPKNYRICLPDGSDSTNPALASFGLVQSDKTNYAVRTLDNVVNSDGTLLVGFTSSPGSQLTMSYCRQEGKPIIINPEPSELRKWVQDNKIEVLNVAGNRESASNPGIFINTFLLITEAFKK